AAAIFHVIAPGRKMGMDAARAEHGAIAAERGRAAPEIPFQPRLGCLLFEVTGPARVAETAVNTLDAPDHSVAHQFAGDAELLHRALDRAGLQHTLVSVHGLYDFDRFVDIVRQRLLAINVLAGAQRGEHRDGVPVVWRGDADGIDVLAREQFA